MTDKEETSPSAGADVTATKYGWRHGGCGGLIHEVGPHEGTCAVCGLAVKMPEAGAKPRGYRVNIEPSKMVRVICNACEWIGSPNWSRSRAIKGYRVHDTNEHGRSPVKLREA